MTTPKGGLDLLDDDLRPEADRFTTPYRELRTKEGWVGPDGHEDPSGGGEALWHRRLELIAEAAHIFAQLPTGDKRPVIVDVGSGNGWAARYLTTADVIAIDLLDVGSSWALGVRADMRRLPIRAGVVDGILFAASLHYGAVNEVVMEAARVLHSDGLMVVVDSPIYPSHETLARAVARSAAYYSRAGYPELADFYHPVESTALKAALVASGFEIERFEVDSKRHAFWRLQRRPPATLVVARRLGKGTNERRRI